MTKKGIAEIPLMQKSEEMDLYHLKSLKNCFQVPQFHNQSFLIGEEAKEFKCNGTVLAVISPVLREILLHNTHKSEAPVEFPAITEKGFAALIRYGFSLDPEIGPENVIDVINAAKELKIDIIYKLALKYLDFILENHINVYFVTYLECASKFRLREVIKRCFDNTGSVGGINEFMTSKTFRDFSTEFVNIFLGCNELPVEEEYVWECIQA